MRSYKGQTCWLPQQWGHKTTNGIFLFMFLLLICETLFIEVARVELLGAVEVAKTQQRWILLSCPLPPVKQWVSSPYFHFEPHFNLSCLLHAACALCSKSNVTCSVWPLCIFLTVSGLPTYSGFDIIIDLVVHAIYFIGPLSVNVLSSLPSKLRVLQ